MKFVLIPLSEAHGTNADDENVFLPAFFMNLISAAVAAAILSDKFLPDLHGWGRFGACAAFVVLILVLSFLPIIGDIICVAVGIIWVMGFWLLIGKIGIVWLKWGLRIFATLFIVVAEGVMVMSHWD